MSQPLTADRGSLPQTVVWVSVPTFNTWPYPGHGLSATILDSFPDNPGTNNSLGWVRAVQITPVKVDYANQHGRGIFQLIDGDGHYLDSKIDIDISAGQWIAVCTAGTFESASPDNIDSIIWWGRISGVTGSTVVGSDNRTDGQIHASYGPTTLYRSFLGYSIERKRSASTNGGELQFFQGTYQAGSESGATDSVVFSKGTWDGTSEFKRLLSTRLPFNIKAEDRFIGNYSPIDKTDEENLHRGGFTDDPRYWLRTEINKNGERWPSEHDSGLIPAFWNPLRILMHEIDVFNNYEKPNLLKGIQLDLDFGDSNGDDDGQMVHSIITEVLNNTEPNAWDLSSLSVGQTLDFIINRFHGLNWFIELTDETAAISHWTIKLYSDSTEKLNITTGAGQVFLPENTPQNVQLDDYPSSDLAIQSNEADKVDKVIVRGASIISTATAHGPQFHPLAAGGSGFGPSDTSFDNLYGTLTDTWRVYNKRLNGQVLYDPNDSVENQLERQFLIGAEDTVQPNSENADQFRSSNKYRHVFARFRLSDTANVGNRQVFDGIYRCATNPGDFKNYPQLVPWCPKFVWNPSTGELQVLFTENDAIAHSSPSPVNATIQSWIPYPAGFYLNGGSIVDDTLDAFGYSAASVSSPLLFEFVKTEFDDDSLDDGQWLKRSPSSFSTYSPSIKQEDSQAMIWIVGKNGIQNAAYEIAQEFEIHDNTIESTVANPNNTESDDLAVSNWRLWLLTCALNCSQHVEAIAYNPALTTDYDEEELLDNKWSDANIDAGRRALAETRASTTLIVENEDLQCHFVHAGTVLDATWGGLEQLSAQEFRRNDFPLAQRIANEIMAYASRPRSELRVELASWDGIKSIPFARIGFAWGNVIDGENFHTINSVTKSVSIDFSTSAPTVTIQTNLPPNIVNLTKNSSSAGAGTAVSNSGASLSRELKNQSQDIKKLKQEVLRRPVESGYADGPSASTVTEINVGGGNVIGTYGSSATEVTGVKQGFTPSSVPTKTPATGNSLPDGLGHGTISGQADPVWIAHRVQDSDGNNVGGQVTINSLSGNDVLSTQTAKVTIAGTNNTAKVYIIRNN